MRGPSQTSYEIAERELDPALRAAGTDASVLGAQLFALVDALDASASLRRALTDPARAADDKAGLVDDLLRGRVDERLLRVLGTMARSRWSTEGDLVEAVERLAAEAVLASAEAEGSLERVEDELFRLGRVLIGERALRQAMTDRRAVPADRAELVSSVLAGKVHDATLQLVRRAAAYPRARSMASSLGQLGDLAAHRRRLLVAEVTAAGPLTTAQEARLAALLERTYGRPVSVNVAVDPATLGGMRIQVGSEVVDSTLLSRLDDVRRRLAG